MAEPSFQLKVVTPNEVAFEGTVVSVTVPGEAGYFGVLANHAAFVSTLGKGNLTTRDESGKTSSLKVEGGFFKVSNNRAIVLTDSVK